MTKAQLKLLNDQQLFDFFVNNAGYQQDAPPESKYSIRIGPTVLFASETHTLREKFFEEIRLR